MSLTGRLALRARIFYGLTLWANCDGHVNRRCCVTGASTATRWREKKQRLGLRVERSLNGRDRAAVGHALRKMWTTRTVPKIDRWIVGSKPPGSMGPSELLGRWLRSDVSAPDCRKGAIFHHGTVEFSSPFCRGSARARQRSPMCGRSGTTKTLAVFAAVRKVFTCSRRRILSSAAVGMA